jgi:hypothetical protein
MVDNALMNIEESSSKRFEKLASAVQAVDEQSMLRSQLATAELRHGLEEFDAKVSKSIAPLLQCVTLEQMELKAKLDSLDASLSSEDMSAKVNCGIAPMLQSMALQQMDFKCQLDSLRLDSSSCHTCGELADCLGDTRKELSNLQELSKSFQVAYAVKVEEVEEVASDLQKQMDVNSNELKALTDEVRDRGEQPTAQWGRILSAAQQDLGKVPKRMKNGIGGAGCEGDSYANWLEGSSIDVSSPIAYSKKSACNSLNVGGTAAAPFARFVVPRQLDRMQVSRSLPHLPAVK